MPNSYYDMLGVSRGASDKEVRAAYRSFARKLHPDVNPGDRSAGDKFKKINEAYEVLSDPRTRKDYDEFGPDWKHADDLRKAGVRPGAGGARVEDTGAFFSRGRPGRGGQGDIFDIFDLSGADFGRAAGGSPAARQSAQEFEVEVTLDEAYRGTTRLLALDRGTGRVSRLEVKVPPGITDGGRVRIRPDAGPELQLVVKVQPDPRFRREGADLYTEVPVPLHDLMLGGEAEVPTMNGKVALKVPAGTQNGRSFRIAGKGMPKLGTPSSSGDLYATVKVVLPESLTDEERRLFELLREAQSKKRKGAYV